MTQDEFMIEWSAKSGIPLDTFETGERVAVRCYCGGNACSGWRALLNTPERLEEHAMSDGRPERHSAAEE